MGSPRCTRHAHDFKCCSVSENSIESDWQSICLSQIHRNARFDTGDNMGVKRYVPRSRRIVSVDARSSKAVRWRRAIQLAALGHPNTQIARELGMSRERVSKWRQDPEFEMQVNEILYEMEETVRHRLHRLATTAVDVLECYLDQGKNTRCSSRDALIAAIKVVERLSMKEEPGPMVGPPDEAFL